MKKLILLFAATPLLFSCQKAEEEQPQTIGADSVFNLTSKWEQPDESQIQWADLKGKVMTVVMIYTSCRTACPKLTADMREIAKQVGPDENDNLRYVLVTIDPKHDTPEKMREFLVNNKMEGKEWVFLRGTDQDTRELANVLAMKYKKISPMEFSHSNLITVFSKTGSMVYQKKGISVDIDETVDQIKSQL